MRWLKKREPAEEEHDRSQDPRFQKRLLEVKEELESTPIMYGEGESEQRKRLTKQYQDAVFAEAVKMGLQPPVQIDWPRIVMAVVILILLFTTILFAVLYFTLLMKVRS